MRCIIPAAGIGTRLRPHTHTKPKALLRLGNKPILSHILDNILEATITDVVIIVGYEKEKLKEYIIAHYSSKCDIKFLEQKERRGLGHAIYTAREFLDGEPILIALGDSLYENSFSDMIKSYEEHKDWVGALTVKSVKNPQSYGVVNTAEDGETIIEVEEKPSAPKSDLAITGVYIIRDPSKLRAALDELVSRNTSGSGGELQLTDALQIMLDKGDKLGIIPSGEWYDCGKKEALLAAHDYVLSKNDKETIKIQYDDSVIIPPVSIQSDCMIFNSIIGPNVSIGTETVITRSIISSSIIGAHCRLKNVNLHDSLIGENVEMTGGLSDLDVGDHSKIQLT
ncbi:MAG: hypothetical protein EAX86_07900 [Candidatus Heimdallarchaeota archaeon]|nr:hypothetical protein [Candidatus Heimdallarchaeota archaeon]